MSDCDDKSINNIARSFIDIYYTTLNNEKSNMKKLYCDFSKFSFTVGEDVYYYYFKESHSVTGIENIQKAFNNLDGVIKVNFEDGTIDALGNEKNIQILLKGKMYWRHTIYMYSQAVSLFSQNDSYFILFDIIRIGSAIEYDIETPKDEERVVEKIEKNPVIENIPPPQKEEVKEPEIKHVKTPSTYAGIVRGADPVIVTEKPTEETQPLKKNNHNRNKKRDPKKQQQQQQPGKINNSKVDPKHHNPNTMYINIYYSAVIKGLPEDITSESVKIVVSAYGEIKSVDVTKNSKGSYNSFIEFNCEKDRSNILSFTNGKILINGKDYQIDPYYTNNVY